MKIIGLCGSSGAGKSTIAKAFSKFGFYSIDTDDVYHKIISSPSECTSALADVFSGEILNEKGGVDRRKLSNIVFKDKDKLSLLNRIAHRYVLDDVRKTVKTLDKDKYRAVLVDAPLLYESGFDKECDAVIGVIASRNCKIERIVKRDGISVSRAEERLDNQVSDEIIASRATYVIYNDDSDDFNESVREIANKINNLK